MGRLTWNFLHKIPRDNFNKNFLRVKIQPVSCLWCHYRLLMSFDGIKWPGGDCTERAERATCSLDDLQAAFFWHSLPRVVLCRRLFYSPFFLSQKFFSNKLGFQRAINPTFVIINLFFRICFCIIFRFRFFP